MTGPEHVFGKHARFKLSDATLQLTTTCSSVFLTQYKTYLKYLQSTNSNDYFRPCFVKSLQPPCYQKQATHLDLCYQCSDHRIKTMVNREKGGYFDTFSNCLLIDIEKNSHRLKMIFRYFYINPVFYF